MSFTITPLVDQRALVRGTDSLGAYGSTILYTGEWESVKEHQNRISQGEAFDAAVHEFFAPLVEKLEAAGKEPEPIDEASYVVIEEGSEPVAGVERNVVRLSRDSIILRLLEDGDTDRLIWVDHNTLEVTAPTAKVQSPVPATLEEL